MATLLSVALVVALALAFTALTAFTQMPFSAFVAAFIWFQLGQSITSGNMQVIGSDIAVVARAVTPIATPPHPGIDVNALARSIVSRM